jgi:hypothetical protein
LSSRQFVIASQLTARNAFTATGGFGAGGWTIGGSAGAGATGGAGAGVSGGLTGLIVSQAASSRSAVKMQQRSIMENDATRCAAVYNSKTWSP